MDMMLMYSLKEIIDQLAMAKILYWCCYVLRREDGLVLIWALEFDVECQQKKERSDRTWQRHIEEEIMKVDLISENSPC